MKDLITAFSVMVLGVFIYFYSNSFAATGEENIARQPDVYPKLVSVVLLVLGLILLIQALVRINKEKKVQMISSIFSKEKRKVFTLILLLVGYIFALQYVGYLTSTILFLFIVTIFLGSNKKTAIISSVLISLVVYVVFFMFFNVPALNGLIF